MAFDHELHHFEVGYRVELHPATDRWMMGDRYGTVTKVDRKVLTVKMDKSNHAIRVHPSNIGQIVSTVHS